MDPGQFVVGLVPITIMMAEYAMVVDYKIYRIKNPRPLIYLLEIEILYRLKGQIYGFNQNMEPST